MIDSLHANVLGIRHFEAIVFIVTVKKTPMRVSGHDGGAGATGGGRRQGGSQEGPLLRPAASPAPNPRDSRGLRVS